MKKTDKWVLFDLDGTLTRSEEGIWNSILHTARVMSLPAPDADTLRKMIGPPLIWSFREYLGLSEEEAQRGQTIYRERYNTVGLFENQVYPGIRNVLRTLRREGARIGLVSGKPENASRRILEHFGLLTFFERICCATDGCSEKDALIRDIKAQAVYRDELKLASDKLSTRVAMAESAERLVGTDSTLVLEGWLPAEREEELTEVFRRFD
jgi:phosphoglycolate phosphatase-like HAD superfamily hydrolase